MDANQQPQQALIYPVYAYPTTQQNQQPIMTAQPFYPSVYPVVNNNQGYFIPSNPQQAPMVMPHPVVYTENHDQHAVPVDESTTQIITKQQPEVTQQMGCPAPAAKETSKARGCCLYSCIAMCFCCFVGVVLAIVLPIALTSRHGGSYESPKTCYYNPGGSTTKSYKYSVASLNKIKITGDVVVAIRTTYTTSTNAAISIYKTSKDTYSYNMVKESVSLVGGLLSIHVNAMPQGPSNVTTMIYPPSKPSDNCRAARVLIELPKNAAINSIEIDTTKNQYADYNYQPLVVEGSYDSNILKVHELHINSNFNTDISYVQVDKLYVNATSVRIYRSKLGASQIRAAEFASVQASGILPANATYPVDVSTMPVFNVTAVSVTITNVSNSFVNVTCVAGKSSYTQYYTNFINLYKNFAGDVEIEDVSSIQNNRVSIPDSVKSVVLEDSDKKFRATIEPSLTKTGKVRVFSTGGTSRTDLNVYSYQYY